MAATLWYDVTRTCMRIFTASRGATHSRVKPPASPPATKLDAAPIAICLFSGAVVSVGAIGGDPSWGALVAL